MKTAGMIGGIGPESTEVYYREIVSRFRTAVGDNSYPKLIINSINFKQVVALVTAENWTKLATHLLAEIDTLAKAGADFGFLAANTPHIVFDYLQAQSSIPLISIVESACATAKKLHLKKLGLFGTRFTMRGVFYPKVFSGAGITLVTPDGEDLNFVHDKYMGELVEGVVLPETRDELLRIAQRLKDQAGIDGLILGGTELSLILSEDTACGIAVLDTTKIHVDAVVRELLR